MLPGHPLKEQRGFMWHPRSTRRQEVLLPQAQELKKGLAALTAARSATD